MGKNSFWRKRNPKKSSSAAAGSSAQGHGDADDVRHDDNETLPPHDGGVDFPTYLKHNDGGIFSHSAEEYHPLSIVRGNDTYPINQISSSGRFLVRAEGYTCSLGDFIAGKRPMATKYPGSNTEHEAPAEWARCLVRGLVDALYFLGDKTHTALHLLENYVVVIQPDHDKFCNPHIEDDYDPKIEVRIVHNVVDSERETITGAQRRTAILDIIFDVIFQGQNNLWEWRTFARYLRDDYIDYCRNHPCLWHWRDRLLLFVKLWSYISAESDAHSTMVSKAISNCHEDELTTYTWVKLLEGHKPGS